MKKYFSNLNPFVLVLAPVLFALLMGVSYQFEQAKAYAANHEITAAPATSLFYKGVTLVKTVCALSKDNVW